MEELTPAQQKIHEEIQKKVGTLKFFRTHLRLAALVTQVIGFVVGNSMLANIGFLVFLLSYLLASSIMEDITLLIWDHADEQKEEDGENETKE